MEQIMNGVIFSFKIKPDIPDRLRRLPRGSMCHIDNLYCSGIKYRIDIDRSTEKFILFTRDGIKVNWWINIETEEVCYDASGSMQNYVERDSIHDFDFTFYPDDHIPSQ